MNSKAQRVFGAVRLLCAVLAWWTRVLVLSSEPQCSTQRVNRNANPTRVVMTCPREFISGNGCTIWWGNVDNGGDYACVQVRVGKKWDILITSA